MPFDTIANRRISVNRIFVFYNQPSPNDRQDCREYVGGSPKAHIIPWNLRLPRLLVSLAPPGAGWQLWLSRSSPRTSTSASMAR